VPIAVPDLRSDVRTQDILLTATIEDLATDYRAILGARGALTPEDEELQDEPIHRLPQTTRNLEA
jgi:hypothetical protein